VILTDLDTRGSDRHLLSSCGSSLSRVQSSLWQNSLSLDMLLMVFGFDLFYHLVKVETVFGCEGQGKEAI
jgi:hypothetical protein